MSETPLLEVRNLDVERGKRQVLFNVSLSVRAGEIVALIGPNGSGKSTLFKSVMGLLPIEAGQVRLDDAPIVPEPRRLLAAGVGYVPQANSVFRDLSVVANLRLAAAASTGRRPGWRRAAVEETLLRYPFLAPSAKKAVGTLSGGEQQTLAVICGFIGRPRLLLLDEPCGSLTEARAQMILDQVRTVARERNMATFVIEQRVREVVALADRVIILRQGSVSFDGSPHDIGTGPEMGRRLLF